MATKQLAKWAANLTPSSRPSSVTTAARRSLYNYIGCAIGGSHHPTVTKAYSALHPFGGEPQHALRLGTPHRTNAQLACLLNGIASHVHDYDDTHLATIIHPTGPVASACLAWAEYADRPITGPELLTAIVAGIETSCKLGLSVWPAHYDIGWHITSTTGSIGAAVAVGKLRNLSESQMAHAIGLAAVQVIGLRAMFGSDTKSFHVGQAAQAGFTAALLAGNDFTSSETALEARRGWGNVVGGGGEVQLDKYIGELGQVWEVERNAFKPFPCGIVAHPAIDGCIQIHKELGRGKHRIDQIKKVHVKVHPLVLELTGNRKPKDGLEGKFSVYHGCAVGLMFGKAGPAQYADEVVTREEVRQMRNKCVMKSDHALRPDEAVVEVTFQQVKKLEKHVEHAVGSLEVPMTKQQLEQKFIDQCTPVLGDRTRKISELSWTIGHAPNVLEILQRIRTSTLTRDQDASGQSNPIRYI
ncbi:hypothetical protein MBLNU457_7295t1 [Dothideomycetes sp. NU457]